MNAWDEAAANGARAPAAAPSRPPELPLSFRQALAAPLFKALRSGWSVALVALPGGGLSNLLRFVSEPRVAAHYLGEEAAHTLLVYLDGDDAADPAALPARVAQQVLQAARQARWPRAEQAALRRLAQAAQPGAALAEMLAFITNTGRGRVVIVADEFDGPLCQWPAADLRRLRRLRDDHKYHLAFVAGFRHEPETLAAQRAGEAGVAKFAELFEAHTFAVRPYARADAELALARKTVGWERTPTAEQSDGLYRASGGHPKLLIAGLIALESRLHLPWAGVERALAEAPGVRAACAALWQALDPAEQAALWLLAAERRDEIPEGELARLTLRGLAVGGPPFVFASLLEAHVAALPAPNFAPLAGAARLSRLRDPGARPYW